MNSSDRYLPRLSASRLACFAECPRRYFWRYIKGVHPVEIGDARSMGVSFHKALELIAAGEPMPQVVSAIYDRYGEQDPHILEALVRLAVAYRQRWRNDTMKYHRLEHEAVVPVREGQERVAIIDAIVEDAHGMLWVMDHKLVSHSISLAPESEYWERLRLDLQMTGYVEAAQQMGYECCGYILDVIRKPGGAPKAIPTQKALGEIVDSGEYFGEPVPEHWHEDARRWLATRKGRVDIVESPEMYGARVLADIKAAPEKYFARMTAYRTDNDIEVYRDDQVAQAVLLETAAAHDAWPMNPNSCRQPYRCDYIALCANGLGPHSVDLNALPDGYEVRSRNN